MVFDRDYLRILSLKVICEFFLALSALAIDEDSEFAGVIYGCFLFLSFCLKIPGSFEKGCGFLLAESWLMSHGIDILKMI